MTQHTITQQPEAARWMTGVALLRAQTEERIKRMRNKCNAAIDRAYVLFRLAEQEARRGR